MQFTISNFTILERIRVTKTGSEIFAHFDCSIEDVIGLRGASLVKHQNGTVVVFGPSGGNRSGASLFNPLAAEIAKEAARLYLEATGVDLYADEIAFGRVAGPVRFGVAA